MNQITLFTISLTIMGLLLHILLSVQKVLKSNIPFSFGRWVQENWINLLVAIICAATSLMFGEDLFNVLGVKAEADSPLYKAHAFVSGYIGRDLVFRVIKAFQPKSEQ